MSELAVSHVAARGLPQAASVMQTTSRITALGGGTGLAVVLRGLRDLHFPAAADSVDQAQLTAIVTVADDGGSSGALRRDFDILAPGDIRNCLLALSEADPTLQALFDFRFDRKIGGHSLGNLMLTALTLLEKDFSKAIERAADLLAVRGQVLPATADGVELQAEFMDGSTRIGESSITAAGRRIRRMSLVPEVVHALPQAREAIDGSDLVVIGPGSLYTSLIPVLLVKDIASTIVDSGARVALVMNLMSEPGETDGYTATDIIAALQEHAPGMPIHDVLLNSTSITAEQLRRYSTKGATPIVIDRTSIASHGCRVIECDLLGEDPKVRHDPRKLARALLDLTSYKDPS